MMFGSILVLFVLPWLDTSPVRSARFRPIYRQLIWVWVLVVIVLGVCGAHKPEGIWVVLSRVARLYYFLHFLVILPILGKLERPLPLPESISRPVIGGGGPMPSAPPPSRWRRHDAHAASSAGRLLSLLAAGCRTRAWRRTRRRRRRAQHWSFDGLFGTFDLASAQRGFQVYSEVCSICHSMQYLHYRDLAGIGLTEDADQGDRRGGHGAAGTRRPGQAEGRAGDAGRLSSARPFPNEKAARAALQRRTAARPVADRQCARGPRRLRLCDPDRLRRSAGRHARCRRG